VTPWCMKEVYLDCKCPLKGMHEGRNLGVCRVWHEVDLGRNNRKSSLWVTSPRLINRALFLSEIARGDQFQSTQPGECGQESLANRAQSVITSCEDMFIHDNPLSNLRARMSLDSQLLPLHDMFS
jgi:hypothetical protein